MAATGNNRILVVDDDQELSSLLKLVLEGEGYSVSVASDAEGAISKVDSESPDLVVLDITLGRDDGRIVLAKIREKGELPVIFISGKGDTADRVLGLRLGADDYIAKPFSPVELVARIESVLRRAVPRVDPVPAGGSEVADGLVLNELTREVVVEGRGVELTAKEFDLLAFLIRSPRQVFSRGQLLEHVWSSRSEWQDEATVTEHVRRVRHKVEKDPEKPRWITTVRGVGYRFEP
ncbi:MAG TPA: response regulator transcription factor [Acidimicrobiales bacterium]|nr:response regulator transcription factor [Acidimicrobiales bacterium]